MDTGTVESGCGMNASGVGVGSDKGCSVDTGAVEGGMNASGRGGGSDMVEDGFGMISLEEFLPEISR